MIQTLINIQYTIYKAYSVLCVMCLTLFPCKTLCKSRIYCVPLTAILFIAVLNFE